MAIDTLAKRFSMLGLAVDDVLIAPDGTIAASDRLALLDLYSGIAAGAPAGGTPPAITSPSTASGPENSPITGNITGTGTGTLVVTKGPGVDGALFTVTDAGDGSGNATWSLASQDFEIPADVNLDGVYQLLVILTGDTSPRATQAINVTVTDLAESPTITAGAHPGEDDWPLGVWEPVGPLRQPKTPQATRPSPLANARVMIEFSAPPAELAISATVVKGAAWLRADDEALLVAMQGMN